MARRRILCLAALAAATALASCVEDRLCGLLLALALALPVLGLLLSLPAMLTCRVRLTPRQAGVLRGGEAGWRVTVENRPGLPLSRVDLDVRLQSGMYGHRQRRRLRLSGASGGWTDLPADTAHCDLLECRVVRLRVCDCLGLFAIRRTLDLRAELPVWPVPAPEAALPALPGVERRAQTLAPKPGGGPGEDYEVRGYRPGDPVRLIHWKLTSKRGEPILRETLEAKESVPIVTFDHFGPPEAIDQILDRLDGLCRRLLESGQVHLVRWYAPESRQVRELRVSSERELSRCLAAAMADPAPMEAPEGAELPPVPRGTPHVHIAAPREDAP